MLLNEALFADILDNNNDWVEVDSKQVVDSDGFMTDYTWYTNGDEHICIFGDKDIYRPGEVTPDVDGFYGEAGASAMAEWFRNYRGFDDDLEEDLNKLTEDFSSSLPQWLVRVLKQRSVYVKLLNRGWDLAHLKFVVIPESEVPASGFHPIFKDDTKQLVYLLRDEKHNIVYMPGLVGEDEPIFIDKSDLTKDTRVKYLSKKQLLEYTVLLGYIELDDPENKMTDIRTTRSERKKGSIDRGKGQYKKEVARYNTLDNGSKDYDNPIQDYEWIMSRGQDKSGYSLNPTKYKDMLDAADLHTYSRQFERYTAKLEKLRSMIIDYIQTMSVTQGVSSWGDNIGDVVRKFEDAIYEYQELSKEIEDIANHPTLTDEEKNQHISHAFDGTRSYNAISSLRRKLEEAHALLTKLIQKRTNNTSIAEKLTMHNYDEFKEIADEIGLITVADVERFKKEEVDWDNGEDELSAIKRYRQELIDSGVDLSALVKESFKLEESRIKDIAIEIDNAGGLDIYINQLTKEIAELKSQLEYLETYAPREIGRGGAYDSQQEISEAIDEIMKELTEIQLKLSLAKQQ